MKRKTNNQQLYRVHTKPVVGSEVLIKHGEGYQRGIVWALPPSGGVQVQIGTVVVWRDVVYKR